MSWISFESKYWDYVTLYFQDSLEIDSISFGILSKQQNNRYLLKSKSSYPVLANFKSSGHFRREDNINLILKPAIQELENKTYHFYLDGIFFGIIFGLAMYNLFLFISIKDRTYLWYTIYIFSFAVSFANLFDASPPKWTLFFTPDFPYFAYFVKKIADPIIWIAYVQFVRNFLSTRNKHPLWDRILIICAVWILSQFLINITGIYHFTGVYRILSWNLVVAIAVLFAIISYVKGYSRARYFIFGQIFLLAGIIITFCYYAGYNLIYLLSDSGISTYFSTPNSIFAFGAIEAILFSLALANKYNLLQKDVARIKIEKEKERSEALRLQELDEFKTRFYANITHEFRTPLTVIEGMVNELQNNPNKARGENLSLIKKHSRNLLSLVNELLDLSKIQNGKVSKQLEEVDLVLFLKYLIQSNESFANSQNIGLQFHSEEEHMWVRFDVKKLEQIVNNLVFNAIKFSKQYGKILVLAKKIRHEEQTYLELLVKDNGKGIAVTDLPYIFDRFHQAENSDRQEGSGIGLSLVKELVSVLNGSIRVQSELGQGSSFSLRFPIIEIAKLEDTIVDLDTRNEKGGDSASPIFDQDKLPCLLIIEDNVDVLYYLSSSLDKDYNIIKSSNGQEGIDKALEVVPDIIICDILMPIKDGLEVCRILKNDKRTSHVPIILLTSKAAQEDKLIGLAQGADAYLVKPFDKKELRLRLQKLIDLRQKLHKKYSYKLISFQEENLPHSKEDVFVIEVEKIILENLDNDDFTIHDLARNLHLSRSQVHRKLKALVGMSSSEYIRHIRLHKARHLIQNTKMGVAEIAYKVGFKTPVYFSQAFKELFGESPSATRK